MIDHLDAILLWTFLAMVQNELSPMTCFIEMPGHRGKC